MGRAMACVLVPVALALVGACGGPSSTGSSASSSPSAVAATPTPGPASVVAAYYAALKSQDCPAAYSLLVDPLRTRAKSADNLCIIYSGAHQIQEAKVGSPYASGQVYGVPVTETTPGGSQNLVLTVSKVNGDWRVSDTARAS
jgi:hypothetical protein